jgi:hypothetical protein
LLEGPGVAGDVGGCPALRVGEAEVDPELATCRREDREDGRWGGRLQAQTRWAHRKAHGKGIVLWSWEGMRLPPEGATLAPVLREA